MSTPERHAKGPPSTCYVRCTHQVTGEPRAIQGEPAKGCIVDIAGKRVYYADSITGSTNMTPQPITENTLFYGDNLNIFMSTHTDRKR